jgi:outer membrane protein assembly factor BamB
MRDATPTAVVIAACTVILLAATCAPAQDWPQWRGPNRDARATGFTAPKAWPKELTQKWKVVVGDGVATPALVGNNLYVFTREKADEVIRSLDATTGKELWKDQSPAMAATGPASRFAGPRSSPTVVQGKVVTLGVRGTLSCLDAVTGKKLWRKDDFPGSWPSFFTASSPIVVDGLCIVQLGGEEEGGIVAYDLETGNQKWNWSGDIPAYASPVLMTVNATKLIIAQTQNKMVAVGAADGKLAWEQPFAVQGRGYNAVTPVVDGQTLIYAGSGRGITAVKLEKAGTNLVARELWKTTALSPLFNTPVLKDGLLYGITQGNEFFCIKAENGQAVWSAPAGQLLEPGQTAGEGQAGQRSRRGGGYGSIVDAGPVLMALTPASQLLVFKPGDNELKQVAKYKVADTETYAHPILAGNRIFIKDRDTLTLWAIE